MDHPSNDHLSKAYAGPGVRPVQAKPGPAGSSLQAPLPSGSQHATDFSGAAPFARITERLSLLLLCVVCAAIRCVSVAAKPFWFDESFSAEIARIDWRNFLHLLWWREANMSLYYLLLRAWLGAGTLFHLHASHTEFFIRSLSVVFAVATVPAICWLAKLLYHRRAGVIAAALFTVNAYSVRYSQEARSYALFVLLATLSSGLLIVFLRQPTRRNRLAYAIISILAVYAHFYALLLLAAHWLAVRWLGVRWLDAQGVGDESKLKIPAELRRAWIAIGIAVSPLLIFVAKTGAGPIRWIQRPGVGDLTRFWIYFTGGEPIVYALICLAAALSLGKRFWRRGGDWDAWRCQFLFVWLLFPIALTVVLSFARPVFLPRYMIFCLPALLILVAAGLDIVRPPALRATLTVLILLLSARAIPYVYGHDFDNERDASGAASDFILDHAQPGDAIIFHIAETRSAYEFSRSLRAGENSASPGFTRNLGPEILFPRHAPGLDYRDFTGKPTPDLLRAAALDHSRLWVMLMYNETGGHPDPTTEMMSRVLGETFPKMQHWQFYRVEVRLYSA